MSESTIERALAFEAEYAKEGGMTVAALRIRRIVFPCACGASICTGFISMPLDFLDDDLYRQMHPEIPATWTWPPK